MTMGILNWDETIEDGDCSFWECPFCGETRVLELDACGMVECWACGKEFEVKDIVEMY